MSRRSVSVAQDTFAFTLLHDHMRPIPPANVVGSKIRPQRVLGALLTVTLTHTHSYTLNIPEFDFQT